MLKEPSKYLILTGQRCATALLGVMFGGGAGGPSASPQQRTARQKRPSVGTPCGKSRNGQKYAIGIGFCRCPHGSLQRDLCETARTRTQSARNPPPSGTQPGAILDADRRHAKRRITL